MKGVVFSLVAVVSAGMTFGEAAALVAADVRVRHHPVMKPETPFLPDRSVMSERYWKIWGPGVQRRIDADIEAYRKADGVFALPVPAGTQVHVVQQTHAFYFGAHLFNFNQLGKKEYNDRYKALYDAEKGIFNSATVGFYWRPFEPMPGHPRFAETERDTEAFWNACANPTAQDHWRRPATDPVIAFCHARGVRVHGHPLVWGDGHWHYPAWIYDVFCPPAEKAALCKAAGMALPSGKADSGKPLAGRQPVWRAGWIKGCAKIYEGRTAEEIRALAPTYFAEMERLYAKRVAEIAAHYGDQVESWDVVNESSRDYNPAEGAVTGLPLQKSIYGFMPGDYAYKSFKWAAAGMPSNVWLNINDFNGSDNFVAQAKDLLAHGARIDVVGSQMHLFDPRDADAIAAGTFGTNRWQRMMAVASPSDVYTKFERLGKVGRPIHLSEITITAGEGNDPRGQMVQANIARNLYRLWFSLERMNGITWWNVVDDCGAPGEPSYSGLFTRDMRPKPAYFVLRDLIRRDWHTAVDITVDASGKIAFRGFRGTYRLTWKDADGSVRTKHVFLK